ncbi:MULTISPECIES: hypothetical protein [unclassified Burkholderia]|uniref:hypothetical protein n=1 Tax=unclassified Burkholderia TaxID=2613784 RepID=UPI001421FD0D|nr:MULTISPECIES: hypothetical protein [unclassified Burkholderia]NIE82061.1 hypothetical protein [Burkholderia sp. Tr-860]NIF62030.1 hypothetical protein [Burkholderia sp. Cy-647]NIF68691.1 hypothetical protein [Burkholderia sp. Ap-962]NIF95257.1 hypothetical protein [Burkholderia sp. Ax-1720]
MKMPEFLFGRSPRHQHEASFLLGETGFSFPRAARPAAPLDGWMQGALPEAAHELLARHGMPVDGETLDWRCLDRDELGEIESAWLLLRAAPGLLSIVVRDARACEPARLREDMARAVARAQRYRASAAIVFVQETPADEAPRRPDALRLAFGSDAMPSDRLHAGTPEAGLPTWFGRLSPRRARQ